MLAVSHGRADCDVLSVFGDGRQLASVIGAPRGASIDASTTDTSATSNEAPRRRCGASIHDGAPWLASTVEVDTAAGGVLEARQTSAQAVRNVHF